MSKKIESVRGMNDILPAQSPAWQQLEVTLRELSRAYGYQEIRTPIVEPTALFYRSIGAVTDIVEKEMYTFDDRNGDSLSLRPEGTAGCVRAGIEHGLFHNQLQRLWYVGPIFRHERPQRGRYRQFYQLGIEAYGMAGPAIDAEIILFSARLLKALGLLNAVRLEINSLGSEMARARYREVLIDYWQQHVAQLDEDSRGRLLQNPLRLLDSKHPNMLGLISNAPKFDDYLDDESRDHFSKLCAYLQAAGIEYHVNPRLVRGLDYYNRTVFEWITEDLGAQGTVCAGGRYDGLVQQLGAKNTVPAVGFAAGIERLLLLQATLQGESLASGLADVYFVSAIECQDQALVLAEQVRNRCARAKVMVDCAAGSLKSQLKRADKSGAVLAVLLNEASVLSQQVTIKFLREEKPQLQLAMRELDNFLLQYVGQEEPR